MDGLLARSTENIDSTHPGNVVCVSFEQYDSSRCTNQASVQIFKL